jgi:hypothetical protein
MQMQTRLQPQRVQVAATTVMPGTLIPIPAQTASSPAMYTLPTNASSQVAYTPVTPGATIGPQFRSVDPAIVGQYRMPTGDIMSVSLIGVTYDPNNNGKAIFLIPRDTPQNLTYTDAIANGNAVDPNQAAQAQLTPQGLMVTDVNGQSGLLSRVSGGFLQRARRTKLRNLKRK